MTEQHIGMVDSLPPTPRAPTPFARTLLEFVLHTGEMDPGLLQRVTDPTARAAYAADAAARQTLDWPALGHYRGENEIQSRLGPPDVVFLGNSITEIWQQASPTLFAGNFVGRGIAGQTSQQTLLRFYPDVVSLRPRAVHILCGGNDVAGNTGPTTPRDMENNFCAMLDIAAANGIKALIGSITPAGFYPWQPALRPAARIRQLNDRLRALAAERDAVFIDYHAALTAPDGSMRPALTNDGVHPNQAAYDIMTPLALAAIAQLLGQDVVAGRAI